MMSSRSDASLIQSEHVPRCKEDVEDAQCIDRDIGPSEQETPHPIMRLVLS